MAGEVKRDVGPRPAWSALELVGPRAAVERVRAGSAAESPDAALEGDLSRRGVDAYQALKLRIYDEVRDRNRDNPYSSLVRLGAP